MTCIKNSNILKRYENEQERISDIIGIILNLLDEKTIFCLQECSEELIKEITSKLTVHELFIHYVRNTENIVTIAPIHYNFKKEYIEQTNCANGVLSISNGVFRIINWHLIPRRFTNMDVFQYINSMFLNNIITFIAGDYNIRLSELKKGLNDIQLIPYYGKTYKNRQIDHIITNTDCFFQTGLILQTEISDHNIIFLNIL